MKLILLVLLTSVFLAPVTVLGVELALTKCFRGKNVIKYLHLDILGSDVLRAVQ